MKIFNKKYLTLLIIAIISLILFRVYFLDKLIKMSIINVSQKIFGARVEINNLHLALLKGQLTIENYTAGNKNKPYQNFFSFKKAEFEINTGALFSKQVHIKKAGISGVEFGTARKKTAVLKVEKKKPNVVTKEINKQTQTAKTYYSFDSISKRLQINQIADFNNLKFLEKVNQSAQSVNKWPADFTAQISSPDVNIIFSNIEKKWNVLQNNFPKSVEKIPDYIKDIDKLNNDIKILNQYVEQRGKIYDNNTKYWNNLITNLNKQAVSDLKSLENKIKQIEAKKNTGMQEIIGPKYLSYIEVVRDYIAMVKKILPAKKIIKKKWYESWLVKGDNIEFPIYEHRPSFLLEKIFLNGSFKNLKFIGEIKEIASDQKVRNIPTTFKAYTVDNKNQKAGIDGFVDLRHGVSTQINAFMLGFPLAPNYWDESSIPLKISSGTFDLSAKIGYVNSSFSLGSDINTDKTLFAKSPSYTQENLFHQLLWKVAEISPKIIIHGEYKDSKLTLDTNLDEALQRVFNEYFEQKKKELMAELDRLWEENVGSKLKELTASYQAIERQINTELESKKKEINTELNKINKEIEDKKKDITDLQKKLGQQVDSEKQRLILELEQKKQAEELKIKQQLEEKNKQEQDKLQKSLQDEFGKLFK